MPFVPSSSFPRHLLVPIAAACLAATTATQNPGAQVVRVRSLAMLEVPAPQPGLLLALPDGNREELRRLDAEAPATKPAWVVRLVESRHREAIDAGRLALTMTSALRRDGEGVVAANGLLLRGVAADVDACERSLDQVIAALARPIEVTAWRLPLPPGPLPATTWDAAALQQALQRTPPLWTARSRTRSGAQVRLAQERGIGFLRDLDVEVASDARISDPKCDVAFAGTRATVTAHAAMGDDLVLTGSWLLSEPVALHPQAIGIGQASIDLPEHRTASVSFAGRVPSGGALVVAGRGGDVGPDFVLVVGARFLAPPPGDVAPDLIARAVGALLNDGSGVVPRLAWRGVGDDSKPFEERVAAGGLHPADLIGALQLQPPAEIDLLDRFLVVHGDVDACRRTDALLTQLFAALRPATLHSRAASSSTGAALELVQPVLGDRLAYAFVGRERAVLKDQEVEIAEKAQAPNPVVATAYSGMWLDATPCAGPSSWHLAGAWTLAAHDTPRLREHHEKPPMTLQQVDYRITRLPWLAPIAPDQEHELGDGPAWTAGGAPTRVAVRLSVP